MLLQIRPLTIQKVSGSQMKELPKLQDAWLLLEDDVIHSFGQMSEIPDLKDLKTLDCSGKIVLPSWCDSHTHLVYAGNREQEFVDRINGLSYQEIAASGGGIINSAKKLQATSQEELFVQSEKRLQEVIQQGTGAIEIKKRVWSHYRVRNENAPRSQRTRSKIQYCCKNNFSRSTCYTTRV